VRVITAPGFPPPRHPAEADLFARQLDISDHKQEQLEQARVVVVGAGGLGSWTSLALVRSGVRSVTIIDHDLYDRSNANRQLMFANDIGQPKAFALARNIAPHMIGGGTVTAIRAPFQEAASSHVLTADALVVLVDNNECRLAGARFARRRGIPGIFSMLSLDSMRVNTFLQGSDVSDACLWCALPNLSTTSSAACASATIAGCMASAAHVAFFAFRGLMGWPDGVAPFNWRSSDLSGGDADAIGNVPKRPTCSVCAV
jgi:molybdopterin/thiamine biosynthesis adenylyltransferase